MTNQIYTFFRGSRPGGQMRQISYICLLEENFEIPQLSSHRMKHRNEIDWFHFIAHHTFRLAFLPPQVVSVFAHQILTMFSNFDWLIGTHWEISHLCMPSGTSAIPMCNFTTNFILQLVFQLSLHLIIILTKILNHDISFCLIGLSYRKTYTWWSP